MRTYKSLAAASLALVLLAACGSSGMGDILGGGSNSGASNYEIRGTVDSVDANSRSIYLTNVSGYSNMLSNSGGSNVRVYYDERTPVSYQGSTYRPEDLERGDVISVRVDEDGNRLIANTMTVVSDATSGNNNSYPSSGSSSGVYGSNVRGTVRYIDMNRRTLEVDTGSVSPTIVEFDTSTPVYFGNSTYRPADLERGDEIDVRLQSSGGSRYVARDITVTRNMSDSGGITGSHQTSTLRGTVRHVDTARRTIELESANWISGFNTGAGAGSVMKLQYDNNTQIDVNGSWQPITGLERGDVIEVQVRSTGSSTYFIDRAFLVRDVRR